MAPSMPRLGADPLTSVSSTTPADTPAAPSRSPIVIAATWMLGAVVSFILMALAGRELSATIGTFQILLVRSLIGLVVIGLLAWHSGFAQLKTAQLGQHVWRNLAHFGGQFGWFFAVASMPLAEVFAIEFTTPIWTAGLAAIFLAEKLTPRRLLSMAVGITGVLLILRPGAGIVQPAALAALIGAVSFAIAYVFTKRLTRRDTSLCILFYMTLLQAPMGLAGAIVQWHPMAWAQAPWLLVVGLAALSAHYCLTRALRLADINVILPIDFVRLPLIALIGYAMYGERIGVLGAVGSVLILAANVFNLGGKARTAG